MTRYTAYPISYDDGEGVDVEFDEDPSGSWVRWEDVEPILAELKDRRNQEVIDRLIPEYNR